MSFRDGNNVIVIIIEHIKETNEKSERGERKNLHQWLCLLRVRFYVATSGKGKFCWFRNFIQATWSGGNFTFLLAHPESHSHQRLYTRWHSTLTRSITTWNSCGWLFGIHYGLFGFIIYQTNHHFVSSFMAFNDEQHSNYTFYCRGHCLSNKTSGRLSAR